MALSLCLRLRGALLILALLGTVIEFSMPSPTCAQAQTPLDERRARQRFESARTAFTDGRYEEALGLFRESYELSHQPVLLYNIGNTLDRLRRDREAIPEYERYLAEVPDAANRAQVESRLLVLRRTAEERESRRVVAPTPAQVATASLAPTGPRAPESAPASEVRPLYKKWWVWSALGAAVVAATVIGVMAAGREPEPRHGPLLLDGTTRKVEL